MIVPTVLFLVGAAAHAERYEGACAIAAPRCAEVLALPSSETCATLQAAYDGTLQRFEDEVGRAQAEHRTPVPMGEPTRPPESCRQPRGPLEPLLRLCTGLQPKCRALGAPGW